MLSTGRPFRAVGLLLVGVLGCSGMGGGCSALQPIPTGRFPGPKSDNPISVRVSPQGISYLNAQWRSLLEVFAPGQKLEIPVPCSVVNIPVLGNAAFGDQGAADGNGQMDGLCDGRDIPQNVTVTINSFRLIPKPPDTLAGEISVTIQTGRIYMATTGNACVFISPIKCEMEFISARQEPGTNGIFANIKFGLDPRWDRLLTFSVSTEGTKICGDTGALPAPSCLEREDIFLGGKNNCGNITCGLANFGPIKGFILQMLAPRIETMIRDTLSKQSCQTCGTDQPACPKWGTATSSCNADGICWDASANRCVPPFLGLEGRLSPAALVTNMGLPSEALVDFSVAAGGSVKVDTGLNMGTRAGSAPVAQSTCVPKLDPPPMTSLAAPNFDGEAGAPYHVGIGIAQQFVNRLLHDVHQSGALCAGVGADTVSELSSGGLIKLLLPSVSTVAQRDGVEAPLMLRLRWKTPPQIRVGEGTVDPQTLKPLKPLLTLDAKDVALELYVLLDDRMVRLFTLGVDFQLPMSLVFQGCSSVQPVIGDLTKLFSRIEAVDSEILAEDLDKVEKLVPTLIGAVEKSIGQALQPIPIPALEGFKLKVSRAKGLTPIPDTEDYEHLGLFAELMPAGAQCQTAGPLVEAKILRSEFPSPDELRRADSALRFPRLAVQVSAFGMEGSPEFAYRLDDGLWSTFLRADSERILEVTHPGLFNEGRHVVEVRARMTERPEGISAPVELPLTVDYTAPDVRLLIHSELNRIEVKARDGVTPALKLLYAFQVGEGAWTDFGPLRPVDLAAVESAGGLNVRVRDELGNIGHASHRVRRDQPAFEDKALEPDTQAEGMGCTASGGALGGWGIAALLWALSLRRPSRPRTSGGITGARSACSSPAG